MRVSLTLCVGFATLGTFTFAAHAHRTVDVYITAQASGQKLAQAPALTLNDTSALTEKIQYVFLDPSKKFQTLLGIGGAITDASAETYAKLPEEKRRQLIKAYYDPVEGIGYSLARTHINSCDFSSASYTYTADGDTELKTFSVKPDEQFRIPLIKEAIAAAKNPLTLYVSPWSPPAWMKDNNHMLRGGKLKPELRDTWARYYVAFIQAYEKAGIPIWGLTVQNEPMAIQRWESCFYTAEEERDFVRDHLGPTLEKNGLADKKIIIWDHNRTLLYERARVALDDPQAAKYIWGVGFHWYVNDSYDNVRLVKEAYPNTHLLLTEACLYPYDRTKLDEWHWGENYGTAILKDFNNGAEGWTDWNILLDEVGGPNHVANYCYAPVHADTKTGELMFMNSFHYIGHFSKFIRPGARRIISSATIDTLQTTAFENPDGSLAVVVLNTNDKDQAFSLRLGETAAATNSPAHSIITLVVR
ncbi:glycoside hydrolase family 30 protein [Oleiharenicola lentus]|uniref:glycoside hydrolase family 30 protein n=1 Tax=Oleiharenicola lentus TaxID=2508720 RepID=UPI003F67C159